LSQPGAADEEQFTGVQHKDDSSEHHVDGCCEESWADEKENALQDEWTECVGAGVF
jgi:hypothetical protein